MKPIINKYLSDVISLKKDRRNDGTSELLYLMVTTAILFQILSARSLCTKHPNGQIIKNGPDENKTVRFFLNIT